MTTKSKNPRNKLNSLRDEGRYLHVGTEAVMTALTLWLVQRSIDFAATFELQTFRAVGIEWTVTVPYRYMDLVQQQIEKLS